MRGRVLIWMAIVLLALVGGVAAQEQPKKKNTVLDLVKGSTKDDRLRNLIVGAGRGLEGVNIQLELDGKPQLFCPPPKMPITGDQYRRMLEVFVERNPEFGKVELNSYGWVLLQAMADVFPC